MGQDDSMVACSNRKKCYGPKPEHRKFHTNLRKKFVTVRAMEQQNRLPSGAAEPPSLQILKTHLCDLLLGTCFKESRARWPPEVPSNPCVTRIQTPVKFYHPNSPTINPNEDIS